MEVRQISTPEERAASGLVSTISFHMRISDAEKWREGCEKSTDQDWAAFAEDGQMMAHIINNQYETYFDGHIVKNGGIGGVSTLPEYRYSGAIGAIFAKLLPQAYKNGEIISTLYPFNHAFYRKAGYETVCWRSDYTFAPGALAQYRFGGRVAMWKPGDDVAPYTALYNRFAAGYNLAVRRDDEMMAGRMKGELLRDRKFTYLLTEGERPLAYVIFQDVYHDPAAILSVKDMAWDGPEGFRAILGFLSRFSADYGSVELFLPRDLELFSVIHAADAYGVKKTTGQDYMARAVNARALLALMKKPEDSRFTIRISDGIIPENNGVFEVCGNDARATDAAPDLDVSVQALAQLALGAVSLDEAACREDVRVLGDAAALREIFVRKPILVEDHF
ncbi:MAG: GNAT family N-acetyltransferase [Bacteroidales bacterium]|nr:GNAT family N-acetyltransferase [Bacteroidales bacterium]